MVSTASLWKKGPVSAASTRGGALKVPSPGRPNPSSRGTNSAVRRAGWSGRSSTPVLKLALPMLPPPEIRRGAGVDVAEIALALGIVQEEPLPSPGDDPSQAEGQLEVLLPPQGELEGLHGGQLLL